MDAKQQAGGIRGSNKILSKVKWDKERQLGVNVKEAIE